MTGVVHTYISAPISRKPRNKNAAKVVAGMVSHFMAVWIWNGRKNRYSQIAMRR